MDEMKKVVDAVVDQPLKTVKKVQKVIDRAVDKVIGDEAS